MKCHKCGHPTRVLRPGSRTGNDFLRAMNTPRRERACTHCDHEFRTYEMDEAEVIRLRQLAHEAVMARAKELA